MIEMPTRSITRFFVPMIDVLTLLFCIYLLMPMVSDSEGESEASRLQRERELLEREKALASRGGAGQPDTEDLLAEIAKLRREKAQSLKNRLSVRVLEIDGQDGRLYFMGPKGSRISVATQGEAGELIRRDQERVGGEKRELYYLVLYPRDPKSAFPTLGQKSDYDKWFADVALGYDVPGVEGSKSP